MLHHKTRPTFKEFLSVAWKDVLVITTIGLACLLLHFYTINIANPLFPIVFQNGEIVRPEIAYPVVPELITPRIAAFSVLFPSMAVVLFAQIWVRSFWDFYNGIIGLLYAHGTATLGYLIPGRFWGQLRPSFLERCKPDENLVFGAHGHLLGVGYHGIIFNKTVCTTNKWSVGNGTESFPSGHSTSFFCAATFLVLYLNGKLKVISGYRRNVFGLFLCYLPIVGATLAVSSSLEVYDHALKDVLAGMLVGTLSAILCYRMFYASILDSETNHIPLVERRAKSEDDDDIPPTLDGLN